MKMNENWIIVGIVALFLTLVVLNQLGIQVTPLAYLLYFVLLITIGVIIIDGISKFANRLVDALAKRQAISNEEINTKIELLMQRTQVIENKVDKINTILEKVSE
ncbi:hypothetical protein ANME2D_00175 [Candidatus Methanoperedens nitroreducens]|uniref:Uncharacterized protein n=1 Tax=Candidatus Methanoperedens nitratireducens TaxID=1392998 RepID=A0A062V1Y8_9EURY|nr:hypothetical protein [Candidatus Methanoperedens nitroreducens]KCZ73116.1 hypothetical protein ANME2D_00175 [Candidatus Methanoperedens nitroreducens]MDJ1422937.1 hypothetical protein [Candidatus Methanoperedens sp.]